MNTQPSIDRGGVPKVGKDANTKVTNRNRSGSKGGPNTPKELLPALRRKVPKTTAVAITCSDEITYAD